jgi:hypothetical protein
MIQPVNHCRILRLSHSAYRNEHDGGDMARHARRFGQESRQVGGRHTPIAILAITHIYYGIND